MCSALRPGFLPGELCCDLEGFSLHAKVAIKGHDRAGLERLCRYEEIELAIVPGSAFGVDTHVRPSYATSLPVLENALKRLGRFLGKRRPRTGASTAR